MARLCPHLGLLALALFVWLTVSVASVRPSIAAEANFEEYFPGMDPESEVKRTTHSRHFQNSDGSTTAVLSVSPIHYEDSNGDLKLYDFTPRYSSRSGFTYQVTGSEVHGYYPSSATGWYRIERHDGYYIAWRETGMFYISPSGSMQLLENPSAGMPVVSGTQLTYPSVYAGVTNYLSASPATIKHD